jgi:transcriptional antiterminator RfaH
MTGWIVVHTHVHAEAKAEQHLERQGYEVYLPKYKKTRRHARRLETVTRPLFPGYLFVRYDVETTCWRPIQSTVGVRHLIRAGDTPVLAPDWVVDGLKGRQNSDGLVEINTPLVKGERVRIASGPLCNNVGVFDSADDNDRVIVLLDLLGRQVRVRLPMEAVQTAA